MLAAIAPDLDLSTEAFPFMTFRRVDLGMTPVLLARINYAGDLGYELWVTPEYQRELFDRIVAAGEPHGLRLFGMRALMSLRLEKSYGTWFREYRPIYTPLEGGITRYIRLDHDFIGRAAHEAELARRRAGRAGSSRSSSSRTRTTRPTSSATSRSGTTARSSAGSPPAATATTSRRRSRSATCRRRWRRRTAGGGRFEIEIIGRRRPARLQPEPLFDPQGVRMRQ